MASPVKIKRTERDKLRVLFNNCHYDRVLIDSVLEGLIGEAYADSATNPTVARLDSGSFTMLGGDHNASIVKELLHRAPIAYITPQTNHWRSVLQDELDVQMTALPFTNFSSTALSETRLSELIESLSPIYQLKRVDKVLAKRLPSEIGNQWFFENFHSIDDFLSRGIGFCILHQDIIVSAATSTSQCKRAIDIEIETVAEYCKQGLASVAGAQLVKHCLENGIEPRWMAANTVSEKLAQKLGYIRAGRYETLELNT